MFRVYELKTKIGMQLERRRRWLKIESENGDVDDN